MQILELLSAYGKNLKAAGKSDSTILAYKKDIEQLGQQFQEKDIRQITTTDIENYVTFLAERQKFGEKTVLRKVNSLINFFNYANERRYISKIPKINIEYPTANTSPSRSLTELEYKAVRDAARSNNRTYTIIELLLQTGMRIGEISRLKLTDIKLNSSPAQIIIREFQSNELRVIDLNLAAKKVLRSYLLTRQQRPRDKGYLFNTRTGKNISVRNIRTAVNRAFAQAGIKKATVNDLRNTFICYQIENGVKLKTIARYVGHKRTISTEKYLASTKIKHPGNKSDIIPL